tara:strand:- start:443 stop:2356 length:1914 start_codon:yes stop_codon:yes gene_type:complete
VGIIARISGCQNQKELSLDDQIDHGKEVAREYYKGEIEFHTIATKGKGERLDRPELNDLQLKIRSGQLDLLIFEDVGRLVRGPEAHRICGIAVDCGTRVISPNDYIDTAEDSWEEHVLEACKDHMKHNSHTSRRLKQKLMNRFEKFGGSTPVPVYGYLKPTGVKTYSEWRKDDEAEPYILKGLEILQRTLNGEAVAEYFNDNKVPTGPYCRKSEWNGRMVLRLYRNPLLKGLPERGIKHTIKHNETGRRIAVPNPNGSIHREEPHLAYFTSSQIDPVLAAVAEKNASCKRQSRRNGRDCRTRVPKKRTRAFGQHATCYYCGSHYVWGGNGVTDNLMCANSRKWQCWNTVGFNGPLAARLLLDKILKLLSLLEGLDEQFQEIVQQVRSGGTDGLLAREKNLQKLTQQIESEQRNMMKVIRSGVDLPESVLKQMTAELKLKEKQLAQEKSAINFARTNTSKIPETTIQLQSILQNQLADIAIESHDFGDLIRELVPEMRIHLVRLCDGGHLLPRANIRLNLAGSIQDAALIPGLQELLTQTLTLDLFEPPQRELIRLEAVALATQGMKQREIAASLSQPASQAAVSKAILLDQTMREAGLASTYVVMDHPPANYNKLRSYKNKKYQFRPIAGYEPPELS